jgi:hypothetical protein
MRQVISVTFTELLYCVVIGTAITRIESLAPSRPTILLWVALLLVFDDYFLYHREVSRIARSGRAATLLFWLDMLVLAVWYGLALSSREPIRFFLLWAALFFAATSLWEIAFGSGALRRRIVDKSDAILTLASLALASAERLFHGPYWIYVALLLGTVAVWRWPDYSEAWRSKE